MADAFRGRLGHVFGTPDLLTQALTHRSHGARHNERLEFIGDAVLNCVVALALYPQYALKRGERAVEGSLAASKIVQEQQQVAATTPAGKDAAP